MAWEAAGRQPWRQGRFPGSSRRRGKMQEDDPGGGEDLGKVRLRKQGGDAGTHAGWELVTSDLGRGRGRDRQGATEENSQAPRQVGNLVGRESSSRQGVSDYRSLTTDRLRSQHRMHLTVGLDNISAAAVSRSRSRTSYHFRGSSRWTCLPRNLTRTGRSPCPCPEVGGALSLLPHLLLPGKTLLPLPAAHSSTRMQGECLTGFK